MQQVRIVGLGDYDNYLSYFTYGVMEGAFRVGAWFRPVPLYGHSLKEVEAQVLWFKPNIVLCHTIFNKKGKGIYSGDADYRDKVFDMLRNIKKSGAKIGYHAGDARIMPRYEGDVSDFLDFGLCNHSLLDKYSTIWQIPCFRWPYMCLYQGDIVDTVPMFEKDIIFTGSLSDSEHHAPRAQFMEKLNNKIPVTVLPRDNPEAGNTRFQTDILSASAKAVLGFQMGQNVRGYIDVRPWQYIGAGALYFHDKCDVMDEFFYEYVHYVSYTRDDVDDFVGKWKFYADNKAYSESIRRSGFRYCQETHSTKQRMEEVLRIVKGL